MYHHLQLPICMNSAKSDFDGDPITIFILACFALGRHLLSLPDVGHVGGRALVTGQCLGLTRLAWWAVAGTLFPVDPLFPAGPHGALLPCSHSCFAYNT